MEKSAVLSGEKVVVEGQRSADQLREKGFGENAKGEYVLDLHEALLLMEKKKLNLFRLEGRKGSRKSKVSPKALRATAEGMDKHFYRNHVVYSDLRERGFVVKTGFKFGFDFRVYPRGKKPGEEHTQWVVQVASQNDKMTAKQLSRAVRLSGNLKTRMLQAVVDAENDVNYYEISRIVP